MRRKQVSGSTKVQQLPRLRDYAPGTDRMALWQRDVRKAASGVSKGKRAQGTSDEHDMCTCVTCVHVGAQRVREA